MPGDPKKQVEDKTEPSLPLDSSSGSDHPNRKYLPILIVPGFMSSGLEIQESERKSSWEGQRVWLNLQSIGFSAFYVGSAQKKNKASQNNDEEEQQQNAYKSQWLEHMRLGADRCSDPSGIRVRAISGLEGVDYLTPGALTNHVSYVFGPVIDALKKVGYQEGINLQAAPYDWRLPPSQLEQRDQYFSRLVQQVEELYQNNHGTPVVLLGHSLGTKTAHYFLNFALQHKGQAWLDRYIHTYLPVGAPHLGAPKALRGMISGDDMGLGTFLSDEEALVMGRSFGSCPWMMPANLPQGAPSNAYILPYGVLEITFPSSINTQTFIENRTALSKPNRFQLIMSYGKDKSLRTPFTGSQNFVQFTDKLSFATSPNPKDAARSRLRLFLQEPGIALAKTEKQKQTCCGRICCFLNWITCCCLLTNLCKLIFFPVWLVLKGSVLATDAATSGAGGGTTLAHSSPLTIPRAVWKGQTATVEMELCHKADYKDYISPPCCCGPTPRTTKVQVQIRWITYDKKMSKRNICSPVSQPCLEKANAPLEVTSRSFWSKRKDHPSLQEFAGNDLLEREGLDDILHLIRNVYDADAIGPRGLSSSEAPPVQRIHAIYGVNLPTEVGGAYKRKDRCESDNKTENLFALDSKAGTSKKSGYYLRGGILYETSKTKQEGGQHICGDGTVPYYSLQHCKTWKSLGKEVSVVELEKAEHREILADPRFHDALLDYCRVTQETA